MVVSQARVIDAIRAGDPIEGDLSGIDWGGLPSGPVVVRNATIVRGDFSDAALSEAAFENVTFGLCRFQGADLVNARFSHCSFFDTGTRSGCDFSGAHLRAARFESCNLSTCRFVGTQLHGVMMQACKGQGADFEDASFLRKLGRLSVAGGSFIECALDFSSFRNICLDEVNFEGTSLRDADFSRSSLLGANFQRADLGGARLSGVQLDRADLRGAVLSGFDLTALKSFAGVKVTHAQLSALVGPLGVRVFPD